MKKKRTILLLAILIIATTHLFAFDGWQEGTHTGTPGLEFHRVYDWGTGSYLNAYAVSRGSANAVHIIIPATHQGLPVTGIASWGFWAFLSMTNMTIPNSVTSIGDYAFWDCTGLTSINIPNSVTSIGNHAFSGCTGLTSINIPNSVTSIGSAAFADCTGLTSINIPNTTALVCFRLISRIA
jgi:hypothetical protein